MTIFWLQNLDCVCAVDTEELKPPAMEGLDALLAVRPFILPDRYII